jgi:hypothetical protein
VPPPARRDLLGSVFGALEVVADADVTLARWQQQGQQQRESVNERGDAAAAAADSLSRCIEAAGAVSPGSDLHCALTAALVGMVGGGGCGANAAAAAGTPAGAATPHQAAWGAAVAAHTARYGPLSDAALRRLVALNADLYV